MRTSKLHPDTFESRSRHLVAAIAHSPLPPEWDWRRRLLHQSLARFGQGIRLEEAASHIARVVHDPGSNDLMFLRHPLADLYLRFRELLPVSLQEDIRVMMCDPEAYRLHGGTENHKLMHAVSGYLASLCWKDWEASARVQKQCGDYLDDYFDRVVRYGQGEFDSSTYSVLYLNTLASLYDFAEEPLMKRKASMMLDWYLLNTAGEWLNGHFAGAQSRDYGSTNGPELPGGGQVGAWLYLGGAVPGLLAGEPHYAVINALSGYRFPEELVQLADMRDEPFLHLESHDLADASSPTHDANSTNPVSGSEGLLQGYGYITRSGVRKTTYRNGRYALGSMTDGKEGDILWSGQLRRWSLKWDSPEPNPVMFVTHPFPDFSPETDRYRAKWQGSSPYEQVLQHKGTLLAVYRIPAGGSYKFAPRMPFPSDLDPYVEGFISSSAVKHQLEKDGWLFCHGGAVMFALRFAKPYEWVYEETRSTDHIIHGRLRSTGLHNGLIVETSPAAAPDTEPCAQQSELQAFACRVITGTECRMEGMEVGREEYPGITYRSLHGELLHIRYDHSRFVNGQEIDEGNWPLISCPGVYSAVGSGLLTVESGSWRRTYDFRSWTVE
jgi:hypothetical protein